MTQEWILEFNKKCAEFLYPNAKEEYESGEINIEDGIFKKGMLIFGHFHTMRFHSDWNWIMEVKHHINGNGTPIFQFPDMICIKENQTISSKNLVKIDYNRNDPDSEKNAIVQAIDQYLDWYNQFKYRDLTNQIIKEVISEYRKGIFLDWKCYEIHTVQARMFGCNTQCKECNERQQNDTVR